jgi:hypothetical protein
MRREDLLDVVMCQQLNHMRVAGAFSGVTAEVFCSKPDGN